MHTMRPAPFRTRQRFCGNSSAFQNAPCPSRHWRVPGAEASAGFKVLETEAELISYLLTVPAAEQLLGRSTSSWSFEPISDGAINSVYAVHSSGTGRSLLFKQAPPYVRSVGESFPLTQERQRVEAAALRLQAARCPQHVPRLLHHDPHMAVLLVQYLGHPTHKLATGIQQLRAYPLLAQQLVHLLLATWLPTSRLHLSEQQHAAAMHEFANTEMVAANEDVVLVLPFTPGHPSNSAGSPELAAAAQALWDSPAVAQGAQEMLRVYRTQKQALIHNDLHAGNLLVTPTSLHLIDWEFATYGPPAFDLGSLIANLLLACCCLGAAAAGAGGNGAQGSNMLGQVKEEQEWLLRVVAELWEGVCRPAAAGCSSTYSLLDLLIGADSAAAGSRSSSSCVESGRTAGRLQQAEQALLQDTLGFAGMCMIRQVVGMHRYQGFATITDTAGRVACERLCLELGVQLLVGRHALVDVQGALQHVRRAAAVCTQQGCTKD